MRICDFLRKSGATNVGVEHGKKHPRIIYMWHGRQSFYVIPGTPGDSLRGHKQAISDLRHILGIVKPVKRIGAKRARAPVKKSPGPSAECPLLTTIPDWHDHLVARMQPEMLATLADIAWRQFWRDCMKKAGGVSLL